MCAYVYLHLHLFVIPLIYWNAHFKYIKKSIVVFIRTSKQHHALIIHVCLAYQFLHSGQVLSSSQWCRWVLPVVFYRDCPCHRPWIYYQYICDIGEEKSLWDGCSSICSRVAICCVGLAARNFGNGRVVLCTWETIIASSGLQLLWEGYVFFGFFVCMLYNIITCKTE